MSTTTPETRAAKDLEVQKHIVGEQRVEQLSASAPSDQQHIQHFLSAKLIDVLTQLLPFIGYPRTLNGLRAIDDVTTS